MFPKKGKVFPGSARTVRHGLNYASVIAAGLRKELGNTHQAIKTVMKWTGANERTVKNWLAGTYGPNGEHLIGLLRNSDEVLDAFLSLAGREQVVAAKKLVAARDAFAAALEEIDTFINGTGRAR